MPLIHTNLSTIKSSKIEYTADYYQPSMSDLSSMLLRISKVLLLKQNQQIANSTNCNEVDLVVVILEPIPKLSSCRQ